jgi:hypothetical protein
MVKSVFLLVTYLVISSTVQGQLPVTEVFAATIKDDGVGLSIESLSLLSGFNPGGYNNQARFFSDDQVYLSVQRPGEKTTDIVKLQLKSNELSWVTQTKEISEFSPMLCPDGKHFTTVRIEKDGKDQSLWQYPSDRSGTGKRLFPKLNNIGYYVWINKDIVALFLVGEPHRLILGNVSNEKITDITINPGRCLRFHENGNLYFVKKLENGKKWLHSYQIQDQAITSIVQMPGDNEDFEITNDGLIIITDGPFIKTTKLSGKDEWKKVADLTSLRILQMQRPALLGNQLLFVNNNTVAK